MKTNPFIGAREEAPSATTTFPPNNLEGDSAALLAIVEGLKNSRKVEIHMIQKIKNKGLIELTRRQGVAVSRLAQEASR